MTASGTSLRSGGGISPMARRVVGGVVVIVLLIAMGLDTTVVPIGSSVATGADTFSPDEYGKTEFPKVQNKLEQRAAPAARLAKALADDKQAAIKQYGEPNDVGPIMAVRFTGTVGEGSSGLYDIKVDGLPSDLTLRVQTGPAINGTVLRDAMPDIEFGDFKNQIEYQNAGAALNTAMKKQVLADLERDQLSGQTVKVVGAFQMINPKYWLVTPVRFSVQQ